MVIHAQEEKHRDARAQGNGQEPALNLRGIPRRRHPQRQPVNLLAIDKRNEKERQKKAESAHQPQPARKFEERHARSDADQSVLRVSYDRGDAPYVCGCRKRDQVRNRV